MHHSPKRRIPNLEKDSSHNNSISNNNNNNNSNDNNDNNEDNSSNKVRLKNNSLQPKLKYSILSQQYVLLLITTCGLLLLSMIAYSFMQPLNGADSSQCRGVYMSPIYARVEGFNESHTRFASKYSLYLYRENNKDVLPNQESEYQLTGTPVLFIPGNAGSFKQVRSMAAQSAITYYNTKDFNRQQNSNNLDFFSADFNEDFTAFHGRTMIDQAEYLNEAIKFILTLYRKNDVPAKSIILVGHSMGGIVARVMLTLSNYQEDSVNTIITLSAPHAAAPVTFDGDLLNVFATTDEFWRNGFIKSDNNLALPSSSSSSTLRNISKKRLSNVSLISITGGLLDTTLPSDYTTLVGLIPETNGFTVSTTGIPGVWTPMDHLAIVWCDQLRKVLAKALLDVVDKSSPTQTYSLDKRMKIFRKHFLTGFETKKIGDSSSNSNLLFSPYNNNEKRYQLKIDTKQFKETQKERTFQLPKRKVKRSEGDEDEEEIINPPDMHLFYVPKDGLNFKFNFISSLKPVNIEHLNDVKSGASPSVLLCKTASRDSFNSNVNSMSKVFDYTTSETQHFVQLDCIDVYDNTVTLPRSYFNTESASESSIGADLEPFHFLEFNSNILSNFEAVVIVESKNQLEDPNFILADIEMEQSTSLTLGENSLWKLFTRGYDITIPAHRPLAVNVDVPSAWSSLLAYSFDIRYTSSELERFSPIIRQTSNDETKWHVNLNKDKDIIFLLQGVSPFCPFNIDDNTLKLQVFSDSLASDQIMDIYLSVDWFKSLKLLVLKYRLSIISFPVFITTFVMFLQFKEFIQTDYFPSFGEGLQIFCNLKQLIPTLISLSLLSYLTSQRKLQSLFEFINPVDTIDTKLMKQIEELEVHVNMFFLGLEENALWFLGPIVLFMSFALVCGFYTVITIISDILTSIIRKFNSIRYLNRLKFKSSGTTRRRLIGTAILLLMIPLYLPYQFAYTVCCFVQITVVLRANLKFKNDFQLSDLSHSQSPSLSPVPASSSNLDINELRKLNSNKIFINFRNFNTSILMLMLWILPVNLPILVVWIHNFSLKWSTPFSSHHNFFAIVPIVLLVQNNVSGNFIKRPNSKFTIFITKFILVYFSLYSLVYGTRHLFWLHNLFNFLCGWLLLIYLQELYMDNMLSSLFTSFYNGLFNFQNKPSKIH